jgi:aspartate kinase
VVIKIGGSVLPDHAAYRRAAEFLCRRLRKSPGERILAVVSAENGLTDSLLRLAREISPAPDPTALDLLWSTGELRSVALLALCLHARGVVAAGLNVHETGLILRDARDANAELELDGHRLRVALAQNAVVVVPGFLARTPAGAIASLGRGGSDLTAVLLAAELGARSCELAKDVPGYFDQDPHRYAQARHLPVLSSAQALAMDDAGCHLVQRQAIEAAARCALPLLVRSLEDDAPQSWILPAETETSRNGCRDGSAENYCRRAKEFPVPSTIPAMTSIEKERPE